MKKLKTIIASILLTSTIFAQAPILSTLPQAYFDPTYCSTATDTGLNPNISRIDSYSNVDSAIQTVVANQPRLVNLGVNKAIEFTKANKDRIVINNSTKTYFQHNFSISIVFHPFDGIAATETPFGVIDGDQLFINKNLDGKVQATMKVGVKSVNIKSQDTIFRDGEYFTPKLITLTYDSSINGVGGFKLYSDGQLLSTDATMNGNTSGFTTTAFNPASLGFGIGIRNRTTADQAYQGRVNAVIIHNKLISASELDSLYQFYTAPTASSLYGLNGDTIKVWIIAGQSNAEGSAPAIEFPNAYKGRQWGTYTGTDNTIPNIVSLTYSTGIWGFRYTLFKDLADSTSKPVFHVMTAVGGTRLGYNASGADWNILSCAVNGGTKVLTQRLIDQSIAKVDACLVKIVAMGYDNYKIMGVLWVQGESDANTQSYADAYGQNFSDLRDFYRNYYSDSTLPFIIGRTHNNFVPARTYINEVRAGQESCSDTSTSIFADPNTFIFNTDSFPLNSDFVHYNGVGQKMLGDSILKIILIKNL